MDVHAHVFLCITLLPYMLLYTQNCVIAVISLCTETFSTYYDPAFVISNIAILIKAPQGHILHSVILNLNVHVHVRTSVSILSLLLHI